MTSLPLDVHEVLEQEYEAIHGPLTNKPAATYRPEDILDPAWATSYLTTCGFTGDPRTVANDIVTTGAKIENLAKSPKLSDTGRELLDLYSGGDVAKTPELRRRIVDEALGESVRQFRDVRLDALYSTLHAKPPGEARAALCISGGGIRSATFALGVIQGLASSGILNKFHYLSTVSGGGYIGSWLSSWSRRHKDGITGVQDDLVRADTGRISASGSGAARLRPESKIDPEPEPLRHLREYSNYLSPKLGLLSADTWTMAALYIRNLLLNVLILVPVLAAIIALPRLFENILHGGEAGLQVNTLGWITTIALVVGFGYLGLARPVKQGHESRLHWINTNKWFVVLCILPLTVAGFGLSIFWAKAADSPELLTDAVWWGVACALAMVLVPCAIYYARYSLASFAERRQSAKRAGIFATLHKAGVEALGAFVGLVTAAGLFYVLAAKVFPKPLMAVPDPADFPLADRVNMPLPMGEIFACFAVPLILIVFFVQASIFVGISSRWNEDNDREWWGRAGAWLLMVAVMGGALSFISVFGPVLLYRAPVILGSMGGVAGIAAALIGRSSKTPADDKQKKSSTSTATSALLGLVVPLFALALIAAISLGTTVVVQLMDGPGDLKELTKQAQFTSTLSATPPEPGYTRKDEMKVSTASVEVERGVRHLKRVHATPPEDLLLIFSLALLATILSRFIGVNRFSMQGLYRNRLIRAYLGASRYSRDPDSFTGFDENDNLQMYELRPELLWTTSFTDPCAFVGQIVNNCQKNGIEKTIWNGLNGKVQKRINQSIADPQKYPLHSSLINGVVQNVNLQMQTIDLATGKPDGSPVELLRKNRVTLETTFKMLKPLPERDSPFHVVNTTLNLVSGEKLAWQQRKAESFTVSPLHCGSFYLGYRDAREYGGDDGISLGTAVAVSGAAASPNQGYHSSLPLAFIMTLLNVRLGSWLGNPGLPGDGSFTKSSPRGNLETLFWELTGNTNDQCPWVYLSDGGHFENLGLYEMVLRRCRFVVLTDGGCDPTFNFDDLGNAIRKIRTDLGVPIEIKSRDMYPRPQPGQPLISGSYVATATIRYSAIDDTEQDGVLIYLKPSVYDEDYLPRDVYNYAQSSETFPHESTSDQFFSESQFESYRALGRHVIDVICDGKPQSFANVGKFAEHVANRPPLRAKDDVTKAVAAGSSEIVSAIRGLIPPG